MGYSIEKVTDHEYRVNKDGAFTYQLTFKSRRWSCTCMGFKHRGSCKHLAMLPEEAQVRRFPREHLEKIVESLAPVFEGLTWEVVGSYRRKAPTSKDLDIIVLCTDDEWHGLIRRMYDFGWHQSSGAGRKMTGEIGGVPVDIDRVDPLDADCWASHLLYRTGPRDLNVRMRQAAKDRGFTLNEHWPAASEREIFDFLGMEYLEPEDRK